MTTVTPNILNSTPCESSREAERMVSEAAVLVRGLMMHHASEMVRCDASWPKRPSCSSSFAKTVGTIRVAAFQRVAELPAPPVFSPGTLARAFEVLLDDDVHPVENGIEIVSTGRRVKAARKNHGVYYTPDDLIDEVLGEAMPMRDVDSGPPRILDPACGAGSFLLKAVERLARMFPDVKRSTLIRECIRGGEIDPPAAEVAAILLRLAADDSEFTLKEARACIRCGDSLLADCDEDGCGGGGGFDLVIGNPPFVDSGAMSRDRGNYRKQIARQFDSAKGNWDLSCVFVEHGLRALRAGGRLSLVVPRRLLSADYAAAIQGLLLEHRIESMADHANSSGFRGTLAEVAVLTVRKIKAADDHDMRIVRADGSVTRVPQRTLHQLPPGHWSAVFAPEERVIPFVNVRSSRVTVPLSELALICDGATTGEAYRIRDLVREEQPGDTSETVARLVNTGTIDPYISLWGRRTTRYLKGKWDRPVVSLEGLETISPRRAHQAGQMKIMIAGLAARIEAVVDEGHALCGKSAILICPKENDLAYPLCAWFNSTRFTEWYQTLFGGRRLGPRSLHVGPRQLAQMPIPRELLNGTIREELEVLSRHMHELRSGIEPNEDARAVCNQQIEMTLASVSLLAA